jgi:hypothetical protein
LYSIDSQEEEEEEEEEEEDDDERPMSINKWKIYILS